MTEGARKLALIVNSASYERVAFALSVATAAAALGGEVGVLFSHGGLVRLRKGCSDEVGEETDAWIRELIRLGVRKGSLPLISTALETLRKVGGYIYACPAAMALHNLTKEELVEGVGEVCSVTEFIRRAREEGATILYV